jgi:hypothetical protein
MRNRSSPSESTGENRAIAATAIPERNSRSSPVGAPHARQRRT